MREHNETINLPFKIKKVLLSNYNKQYLDNINKLEPYEAIVVTFWIH